MLKTILSPLFLGLALTVALSSPSSQGLAFGKIRSVSAPTDLADLTALPEPLQIYLYEEQVLHNKDLWSKDAFSTTMNPKYLPERRPQFALAYYLLPESVADFCQSASLDPAIAAQISVSRGGLKYYKLFVHPESENHYRFLKKRFTYTPPEQSEFFASPTSSYRSLVVWNRNGGAKPFIAKVSLDRDVIRGIDRLVSRNEVERSISNQIAFDDLIARGELDRANAVIYPESAGLALDASKFAEFDEVPEKLGGQLIREFPDSVIQGQRRFISFSSLMSELGTSAGHPILLRAIELSGMSATAWVEKYLVYGYLKMLEQVSLVHGLNFEPHSQNLSLELDPKGRATGRWVIRDFGGVWPDIPTMALSGGNVTAYSAPENARTHKFAGGRSNVIASYLFFYRRQVFDMALDVLSKYDAGLKHAAPRLREALDQKYLALLSEHFSFRPMRELTLDNREELAQEFAAFSHIDRNALMRKGMPVNPHSEIGRAILAKRKTKTWVSFQEAIGEFWLVGDAILEVNQTSVVGMGVWTPGEGPSRSADGGAPISVPVLTPCAALFADFAA